MRRRVVRTPAKHKGLPRRQLLRYPLGQLLLDGGFATRPDLERALKEQARTNELLEEVLVRLEILDPAELNAVLSIQGDLTTLESAIEAAAGMRKLLGELLLDARRITPEQLEQALQEQKETAEKLGEILVRRGLLSDAERDAVLAFQKRQGKSPSPKFRLGEILVSTGQITREQLDRALARQRETRKKIGEILVDAGDIRPHQVEHGLKLQRKIATAALLAVLAMAGSAGAQDAARPAKPATATVYVTARIPARVTLRVLRQITQLVITKSDIARGYVDVPAASVLEVRNNNPKGYLLCFDTFDGPASLYENILVWGLEKEVQVGPGSGWVPQPYVRGVQSLELSYRFILHKDALPGTYAWPISLSALCM